VTDDTQMTLAVAAGILERSNEPVPAVGRQFINWYKTEPKDIGNACRTAIGNALLIKDTIDNGTVEAWELAAKQADKQLRGQTGGNGALMRTIYPALYYDKYCGNFAAEIGAMTHQHDDSRAASGGRSDKPRTQQAESAQRRATAAPAQHSFNP
jgi:ADP-ribosyl-[dinitrogen reductase] hydrolase